MEALLGSGVQEAGLVLFTTLTPSAAAAVVCMAAVLALRGVEGKDAFGAASRYLAVPLAVALIGFIASTTRLGTPANALYVFLGLGRSPLSNEVVATAAFLGVAGLYWIASFGGRLSVAARCAWLGFAGALALVCIYAISRAYATFTIPTWDTPYVTANLWLEAFLGGPLLAAFALRISGCGVRPAASRALLALGAVSAVIGTAVLLQQAQELGGIANCLTTASSLVPNYTPRIVLRACFSVSGLLLAGRSMLKPGAPASMRMAAGVLLAFLGIFIIRCDFYAMYMTVGF